MVVFFTSSDCGACHHLRAIFIQYLQEYNDLQVFEVDAAISSALTHEFDIFHLPSLFLYHDGRYHCEFHCEALPIKIHQALRKALLITPEEEP